MLVLRETFPRVPMRSELPRGIADLSGAFNTKWQRKPHRDQPGLAPAACHLPLPWREGVAERTSRWLSHHLFLYLELHSDSKPCTP